MVATGVVHKMTRKSMLAPLRAGYPTEESAIRLMRGVLMSVESSIREKLAQAFQPSRLDVSNESHLHAGHRASPGTGESHFRVVVVSARFAGKSRVERHRLINEALAAELKGKVHALAIAAHAPGEKAG